MSLAVYDRRKEIAAILASRSATVCNWSLRVRSLWPPIGEVHFDGVPAAEMIDDWLERDVERAIHGHEFLLPVAAAEGHGPESDAVLHKPQRQMPASRSDTLRRIGQSNVARAEDRPRIAVAEWGQAFDLLNGLVRQRGERRLGVDEELGDTIFGGDVRLGIGTKVGSKGVDRR